MGSIGVIVRADRELHSLPADWVPAPLGSRREVLAAIHKSLPANDDSLALELRAEEETESEEPRSISASGVWGPKELAVIKTVCELLDARFYDAEAGDFLDL